MKSWDFVNLYGFGITFSGLLWFFECCSGGISKGSNPWFWTRNGPPQPSKCPSQPSKCPFHPSKCPSHPSKCPSQPSKCTSQGSGKLPLWDLMVVGAKNSDFCCFFNFFRFLIKTLHNFKNMKKMQYLCNFLSFFMILPNFNKKSLKSVKKQWKSLKQSPITIIKYLVVSGGLVKPVSGGEWPSGGPWIWSWGDWGLGAGSSPLGLLGAASPGSAGVHGSAWWGEGL